MSPVRVLGLGGLCSSALLLLGGFLSSPVLVGAAGAVMLVANLYASIFGNRH